MAKTYSSYTALLIHSTGCPKNHGKENNVVKSFYRVYQESWPKKLPCYIILQGVPLNMMDEKRLAKIVLIFEIYLTTKIAKFDGVDDFEFT